MKNGFSKYLKMRPPASRHGTLMMREIAGKYKAHPMFRKKDGAQSEDAKASEDLLAQIHAYKPKQAVKMAFKNPYTAGIQHIIDYAKKNAATHFLDEEKQTNKEATKKLEEKDDFGEAAEEEDKAVSDPAKPESELEQKSALNPKEEKKVEQPVVKSRKRARPEKKAKDTKQDFKDSSNYITLEATKSPDRLRQVLLLETHSTF